MTNAKTRLMSARQTRVNTAYVKTKSPGTRVIVHPDSLEPTAVRTLMNVSGTTANITRPAWTGCLAIPARAYPAITDPSAKLILMSVKHRRVLTEDVRKAKW